ncbi:MAG: LutB/LldF family L-lactate oxidation iron-sulfur protein [Alphaproteobacteria bacterium]
MSAFEPELFPEKSRAALDDAALKTSLRAFSERSRTVRANVIEGFDEFDALRDLGRDIKDDALSRLDQLLTQFEQAVKARGGEVHWARDAAEARAIILKLARDAGAKTIIKSKSMVSEEIDLVPELEGAGIRTVETDLGEYIIQLRHERPSHIIAPAIHLSKGEVADTFREHHASLDVARVLETPASMVKEAREILRRDFANAEVGITGANFLVAETGSAVLVTNEGNADLSAGLPRTHIVLTGIEKVVPTFDDAAVFLRLLARSAVGQEISTYTSVFSGPRQPGETEGPTSFHVVLLDNGRSSLLGTEFQEVLRCIRCGACLNHCPVFGAISGHGYGSIYPGPIGAVLTPGLVGIDEAHHLPNASTLCGRCEEVCPVRIPLPKMLRHWREREFARAPNAVTGHRALAIWSFFASSPRRYRFVAGLGKAALGALSRIQGKGWIKWLPALAGGWTKERDMRIAPGASFQAQWRERGGE